MYCWANSEKEKSDGNYVKHKIIEEVSFMLFREHTKNLNKLKGERSNQGKGRKLIMAGI